MTTTGTAGAETTGPHNLRSRPTSLDVLWAYDLAEVALMDFGHRDERQFDGVMRLAFCLETGYETPVGVEARQEGGRIELWCVRPAPSPSTRRSWAGCEGKWPGCCPWTTTARLFDAVCHRDPVLARLHAVAPGFRPALFYSPYEAAVWSSSAPGGPGARGLPSGSASASRLGPRWCWPVGRWRRCRPRPAAEGRVGARPAGGPDPSAARDRGSGAAGSAVGGRAAGDGSGRGDGRAATAARDRSVLQLTHRRPGPRACDVLPGG